MENETLRIYYYNKKTYKNFTIALKPDEYNLITANAKKHNMTKRAYIIQLIKNDKIK